MTTVAGFRAIQSLSPGAEQGFYPSSGGGRFRERVSVPTDADALSFDVYDDLAPELPPSGAINADETPIAPSVFEPAEQSPDTLSRSEREAILDATPDMYVPNRERISFSDADDGYGDSIGYGLGGGIPFERPQKREKEPSEKFRREKALSRTNDDAAIKNYRDKTSKQAIDIASDSMAKNPSAQHSKFNHAKQWPLPPAAITTANVTLSTDKLATPKAPKDMVQTPKFNDLPLWKPGKIPEIGANKAVLHKSGARIIENDGQEIERAHAKKYSYASPLRYKMADRMNRARDPEMDPTNPMYDYDNWFNNFILKTKLTRLVSPEGYKAGGAEMYYPYDVRRYILRNPIVNPEVGFWINTAGDNQISAKMIKEYVDNMREMHHRSKPDARNLIYNPTNDTARGQELFDLLHLSDQMMMHEYTDEEKQKTYLAEKNPYDTHFKRFLQKALEQYPPFVSRNVPRNQYASPALMGDELNKMKHVIGRVKKPTSAPKEQYFDLASPVYDPVLDLHVKLHKSRPYNGRSIFDPLAQELTKTAGYLRKKDATGNWFERALADIKRPNIPHAHSAGYAPQDPFSINTLAAHYGGKTFTNNNVLNVLPEAAPFFAPARPSARPAIAASA